MVGHYPVCTRLAHLILYVGTIVPTMYVYSTCVRSRYWIGACSATMYVLYLLHHNFAAQRGRICWSFLKIASSSGCAKKCKNTHIQYMYTYILACPLRFAHRQYIDIICIWCYQTKVSCLFFLLFFHLSKCICNLGYWVMQRWWTLQNDVKCPGAWHRIKPSQIQSATRSALDDSSLMAWWRGPQGNDGGH